MESLRHLPSTRHICRQQGFSFSARPPSIAACNLAYSNRGAVWYRNDRPVDDSRVCVHATVSMGNMSCPLPLLGHTTTVAIFIHAVDAFLSSRGVQFPLTTTSDPWPVMSTRSFACVIGLVHWPHGVHCLMIHGVRAHARSPCIAAQGCAT